MSDLRNSKNKIMIKSKLEKVENVLPELSTVQQEKLGYVGKHESKGAYSSNAENWHDNERKWLRDLRYRYFHFSVKCELGLSPRLGFFNGKRQRYEFDG